MKERRNGEAKDIPRHEMEDGGGLGVKIELSFAHPTDQYRPFALVLAGGGARGFAHAGVLRALEHQGYRPGAIVGVSMGAIVGAAYALNADWYDALMAATPPRLPKLPAGEPSDPACKICKLKNLVSFEWMLYEASVGWGPATNIESELHAVLSGLTLGKRLEDSRLPIVVIATDLCTGRPVAIQRGSSEEAIYASGALAGVFPPLEREGYLLADGGYSSLAPIEVARNLGFDTVIAVDPDHYLPAWKPATGLQAVVRAMEIGQRVQLRTQLQSADLVLRPRPSVVIGTLDFEHKRVAVAAGMRVARAFAPALRELLGPPTSRKRGYQVRSRASLTDASPRRASLSST